jgi:hypothetical protein
VSSVGTVAIIGALAALLVMANWSTTRGFLQERPALPPKQTSVAQAIIRIPRDALIVSNAPDAVYDMSGSGSIALPFLSGPPTPEYERDMRQVVELFERRGGYLALVRFPGNPISMRPELQQSLKMHLIAQSPAHQPTAQLYQIEAP